MDIMLTQMMFANNARINAKHALKLHPSAQVALQIELFKLIYVIAYQAFMIQPLDAKDAHTNAILVKIPQPNVQHVIQYLIEHYNLNSASVIQATLILGLLFVYNVHKHV